MDDDVISTPNQQLSTLKILKTGVFLGAEITGVDLTQPISTNDQEAIASAHVEHGVIALPGQKISSEDLLRFAGYFGDLSVHPFSTSDEDTPELIVYDNKKGNPQFATDVWHSDECFRERPAMGTILCCKVIPEIGGDTNFASMVAIYESLSDRMQQFLTGLEAIFDFLPFKQMFPDTPGGRRKIYEYGEKFPKVTHPIIRVHPVNGRKALYVNPLFTVCIKGMEAEESSAILDLLYRKTLRHEYHYRHRWQTDMLVFWDNRQVQHSALYDYYPKRRLMERVTLRGDRPMGYGPPANPKELRRFLMPPMSDYNSTRNKRQHEL